MDREKIERIGVMAGKILVCFMVFLVLLGVFFGRKSNPVDEGINNAKTTALLVLRRSLRDPGSLELIKTDAGKTGENEYFVQIDYRAKNGFGGYSVESISMTTDKDGNVLEIY